MDLGKHKTETLSSKTVREDITGSLIEDGVGLLKFTFVPETGRLPSQVLLGKDSTYLPKIVVDHKGAMPQKPEESIENISEKSMHESSENVLNTYHRPRSEDRFSRKKVPSNDPEAIKNDDLFIAEFVVVMDSDDSEEEITIEKTLPLEDKGNQQSTTVQPKAKLGDVNANEMYVPESQQEFCHDVDDQKLQPYKIKSSYKAFAAIPTNTLLLDQKAIDEPEINATNTAMEDTMETHTEMCSPALLRQQTEEICAAIDEHCNSASAARSSEKKCGTKSSNTPRPLSKSTGRETKYASVQPLMNTKTKDLQTKPGVIRPTTLKVNTIENKEERFYSNPFQQFSMPPHKRETDFQEQILGTCNLPLQLVGTCQSASHGIRPTASDDGTLGLPCSAVNLSLRTVLVIDHLANCHPSIKKTTALTSSEAETWPETFS
ncbi:muscular LMNA-interacting protein isoform X5 [Mixophyes fleayi]|uniref:muscular LMNA-interacting protein isoform X5 n=1 Tax=Mixophyes fleayi TaxID=3061075 RepID=UPI003F4E3F6D